MCVCMYQDGAWYVCINIHSLAYYFISFDFLIMMAEGVEDGRGGGRGFWAIVLRNRSFLCVDVNNILNLIYFLCAVSNAVICCVYSEHTYR